MRGFVKIIWLELTLLIRTKTLVMLTAASVVWMLALPWIATGDGTVDGTRELYIHYSIGGVFALVVVALLSAATGSLAKERVAKRLSLTLIRPVRHCHIVLAKGCALTIVGALVLAVACAILLLGPSVGNRSCRHVLSPVLPSVHEEAKDLYDAYMKHPDTPEGIRRANRSTILRILENRAADRYETVRTNATAKWRFDMPEGTKEGVSVRLHFSGQMDSRQDLIGRFRLGDFTAVISNMTQTVLEVPLVCENGKDVSGPAVLVFENQGRTAVMMRPRKDLEILLPADAFAWNLLRAYVELVSMLSLMIAFGLFLSASLGRPVALFVAMVALVVGEISPSIVTQYPDELGAGAADRIGLALTRVATEVTRPISSFNPIARLANDVCIEPDEVVRVVIIDLLFVPLLLAILAGFVLPRKAETD